MNTATPTQRLDKSLRILLLVGLTGAILYVGRDVFVPLSFSLLISCILFPVCIWLEKRGINSTLAIGISLLIILLLCAGVIALLVNQVMNFYTEWPVLQTKIVEALNQLSTFLSSHYNISLEEQTTWLNDLRSNSGSKVIPFIQTTLGSLSMMIVYVILIPIISALILFQRRQLFNSLHHFTPHVALESLREMLYETINTYYNFIKGMLLVYLIVGILNSVGLLILGIPHAFLFGFIAAILTFIPYVGIMIGAVLPMVVSWITFNSLLYPAGVIVVFTIVQYLEANVIFPWAVSSKLNVNTLSTIVAILLGGLIWGTAGMILFVPFLGILKVLADKTKGMEGISALLGTKSK